MCNVLLGLYNMFSFDLWESSAGVVLDRSGRVVQSQQESLRYISRSRYGTQLKVLETVLWM